MLPTRSLLTLSWAVLISAQTVIENLSFNHHGELSKDHHTVPGWLLSGDQFQPQLLSDRIILTPPYGGNKRGAVWAQVRNREQNWEADFAFRVSGPDHGKANLAFWYVKEAAAVGTASIYSVGKFDGLALMVDQNNGVQKIRGFLNDGSTEYRSHHNVDSLAFGHCDHAFRNLGGPLKLQVKSTTGGFEVSVDGKPCFSSPKVTLPVDYSLGLTAASADPPDSVEVFHFETITTAANFVPESKEPSPPGGLPKILKSNSGAAAHAAAVAGNDASYQKLDQRLTTLEKSLNDITNELSRHGTAQESRYNEILQLLKSGHSANAVGAGAAIGNLETRISNIDHRISSIAVDMRSLFNHDEKFARISKQLQDTHEGLTEHLPSTIRGYVQHHTPRIGFIVFSFMAFQSCCLIILLWQKYRKGTMPKKFL